MGSCLSRALIFLTQVVSRSEQTAVLPDGSDGRDPSPCQRFLRLVFLGARCASSSSSCLRADAVLRQLQQAAPRSCVRKCGCHELHHCMSAAAGDMDLITGSSESINGAGAAQAAAGDIHSLDRQQQVTRLGHWSHGVGNWGGLCVGSGE